VGIEEAEDGRDEFRRLLRSLPDDEARMD